jgi:hypothetical protein
LSVVDASHASLSPFVCEVRDATHQVKVETSNAVTVAVSSSTPFVVIRWSYVAVQANAYADILAVTTPAENDVVVAKCNFSGASLLGFDMGDSNYPRTIPKVQNKYLYVEETPDVELRVRIHGGYVQSSSSSTFVPDQKSNLLTLPTANSKVYLIYVSPETGGIGIDSSGVEAASPVPPNYQGKLVLAEITLSSTSTNITQSMIRDVRTFLTAAPTSPDDVYIELDGAGKYSLKDDAITPAKLSPYIAYDPRLSPGWYEQVSPNIYTKPTEFVSGDPEGRLLSLGQIDNSGLNSVSGSKLFKMKVYNASGAVKSISQILRHLDDNVYFYLNNTTTSFASVIGWGSKSDIITWNLAAGINDLYIVANSSGGYFGLVLMGDILTATDVYFVGNV